MHVKHIQHCPVVKGEGALPTVSHASITHGHSVVLPWSCEGGLGQCRAAASPPQRSFCHFPKLLLVVFGGTWRPVMSGRMKCRPCRRVGHRGDTYLTPVPLLPHFVTPFPFPHTPSQVCLFPACPLWPPSPGLCICEFLCLECALKDLYLAAPSIFGLNSYVPSQRRPCLAAPWAGAAPH